MPRWRADHRSPAFASIAGWFHDTGSVAAFYGGADGVRDRFARSDAAAERFLADGDTVMVPAYDPDDDSAAMTIPMEYYASPDRGAVGTWRNEMAELSWRHWLGFDGIAAADAVEVPTLFVHSEDAVLPDNVRAIANRMAGPVEQVWLGGEQTNFYDQTAQVDPAIEAIDAHLRTYLGAGE